MEYMIDGGIAVLMDESNADRVSVRLSCGQYQELNRKRLENWIELIHGCAIDGIRFEMTGILIAPRSGSRFWGYRSGTRLIICDVEDQLYDLGLNETMEGIARSAKKQKKVRA